jgi:hypothetical protein
MLRVTPEGAPSAKSASDVAAVLLPICLVYWPLKV